MNHIITCPLGQIQGSAGRNPNVAVFRGVPYAKPPIGDLRWKAPVPVSPWKGIWDATYHRPIPMQTEGFFLPAGSFDDIQMAEDCLYLNIWTPDTAPEAKLPVFFWMYGGAFQGGCGSDPMFDGEAFAQQGIVAVTINYRVGIMGFLCHPDMKQEAETVGNFGLLDQIAALHWVKDHIASFGGDPEHITIGGQSAGSMSVANLMCSPLSRDLICGAICESADPFMRAMDIDIEAALDKGVELADKLGVGSLEEMRKLSASALIRKDYDAMRQLCQGSCVPVVDGIVLEGPQSHTILRGESSRIPMLMGSNNDEGRDNYERLVNWYGPDAERVAQAYPIADEGQRAVVETAMGPRVMQSRYYAWAAARDRQSLPTWVYLYAKKRILNGELQGATHSAELCNVFHTLDLTFGNPDWSFLHMTCTPEDYQMEDTINRLWAQFIKTGNPNDSSLPAWPLSREGRYLWLDDPVTAKHYADDPQLNTLCQAADHTLTRLEDLALERT